MTQPVSPWPRVLMVVEHASLKMGGEAARPLHYFHVLRSRGVQVWMIAHARVRDEISSIAGDDIARFFFVPDTWLHKLLWKIGRRLPHQIRITTTGAVSHFLTQWHQRTLARRLVKRLHIDLVHEPIPISPRQPSLMYDLGALVVIGPLNGDINYPPAFSFMEKPLVKLSVMLSRSMATLLNGFIPGKRRAATLLVSNRRTRRALPRGCRGQVAELIANAVDLSTFAPKPPRPANRPTKFVFLGRLVDFKMVDLLLEAFKPVAKQSNATLDIIGDGKERNRLQQLACDLRLGSSVTFTGWLNPAATARRLADADVLVFPSLRECGGAVVMEAMAVGLPVIAADWGGPADYVGDDGAGILIQPTSREALVSALSDAMAKLANDPALLQEMSQAARRRALSNFDWESRVDRLLDIYVRTASSARAKGPQNNSGKSYSRIARP